MNLVNAIVSLGQQNLSPENSWYAWRPINQDVLPPGTGILQGSEYIQNIDLKYRLLHHCHIVNIRGNSFRMRQHSDLWKQLHQIPDGDSASASSPGRRTSKKKELTT